MPWIACHTFNDAATWYSSSKFSHILQYLWPNQCFSSTYCQWQKLASCGLPIKSTNSSKKQFIKTLTICRGRNKAQFDPVNATWAGKWDLVKMVQ